MLLPTQPEPDDGTLDSKQLDLVLILLELAELLLRLLQPR